MWEVGAGAGSAQKEGFAAVSRILRSSRALRETGLGDEVLPWSWKGRVLRVCSESRVM